MILDVEDKGLYLGDVKEYIEEYLEPYGYRFRCLIQCGIKPINSEDNTIIDGKVSSMIRFNRDQSNNKPNKTNPTEVRIYLDSTVYDHIPLSDFIIKRKLISLAASVIYQHIMVKPYSYHIKSEDDLVAMIKGIKDSPQVQQMDLSSGQTISSSDLPMFEDKYGLGVDDLDVNGLIRCPDCGKVLVPEMPYRLAFDIVYSYFRYLIEAYFRSMWQDAS